MGSLVTRHLAVALLTCAYGMSSIMPTLADELIPADIAYRPPTTSGNVSVGTADVSVHAVNGTAVTPAPSNTPEARPAHQCPSSNRLQKSVAITSFLRADASTSTAGNLFAAEQGLPLLIKERLADRHQLLSPAVLPQGFADVSLKETQLKQQAQTLARKLRTQFVLSGRILDMSMASLNATYHPGLFRQVANVFHDITTIEKFDARTRVFSLVMELRDGFTGEMLFSKHYNTTGIWNTRAPIGFNSPAFAKTSYGKQINNLVNDASAELADVIHCQPFMAQIDARPGQTQILLHGGANNGLHAGDNLHLYQLIVQGSNSEYQVSDTRLVKRNINLYLSEVYPSHSIATLAGGGYLNGQYLAVSE